MLVEAPPTTLPPHLDRMFLDIIAAGYTPILAHVERYRWAERAMPWVQNMVISASSCRPRRFFFGDYGHSARELSMRLLDEGAVDPAASDRHDNVPAAARASGGRGLPFAPSWAEREGRAPHFRRPAQVILLGETVAAPQKARAEVL